MPAHIDTAPSVPFDLATVAGGAQRPTSAPARLDLDLMARIAVDAGRAATEGRADASPFDVSPAMREVADHPEHGAAVAAARLYRAALRGAIDPATD